MTKAELEAIVNAYLVPSLPLTVNGQHKPSMQALIDELYNAQSRADVLNDVTVSPNLNTNDMVLVLRGGGARGVPTTVFAGVKWRGPADISSNLYPTNGSGSGGAVVAGDTWKVTVAGSLDLGSGAEPVPVKSILMALDNVPAQDPAKWRVI